MPRFSGWELPVPFPGLLRCLRCAATVDRARMQRPGWTPASQNSNWARYDQLMTVQQQPARDGEKTSQPTPRAHAARAWGRASQNKNPARMVRPQPSHCHNPTPEPAWGTVSTFPLPHNHPFKFCWKVSSAWKEPNLNYSRGKETQNLVFRLIPGPPP